MSGYVDCGCYDCFEIAITDEGPALCWECKEAGCEIHKSENDTQPVYCCRDVLGEEETT